MSQFRNIENFFWYLATEQLLIVAAYTIIVIVVTKSSVLLYRLIKNKIHGVSSKPFNQTGKSGDSFLIIGDSTAVGAGATSIDDTIGGRLAKDFPNANILNLAVSGSLIDNLSKQIKPVADHTYDLIIISTGGNDVWNFTRLKKIESELQKVLPKVKKMCPNNSYFLVHNSFGSAPFFPKILRGLLKNRCRKVEATVKRSAKFFGIKPIDIFNEAKDNPFIDSEEELFSSDGVHPSSLGYRLWYNRMWRKIVHDRQF